MVKLTCEKCGRDFEGRADDADPCGLCEPDPAQMAQRIAALEAYLRAERTAKCKAELERDEALAKAAGLSGEIGSLGAHVAELKAESATLADNNQVLARGLAQSLSRTLKLEAEAVRLREDRERLEWLIAANSAVRLAGGLYWIQRALDSRGFPGIWRTPREAIDAARKAGERHG